MKIFYVTSMAILFFSCTSNKTHPNKKDEKSTEFRIVISDFNTIIESTDVKGSILIYDFENNKYYSNDFQWAEKGNLPASTFKIPNSIIALETGVVENDSTLFKWYGEKR